MQGFIHVDPRFCLQGLGFIGFGVQGLGFGFFGGIGWYVLRELAVAWLLALDFSSASMQLHA